MYNVIEANEIRKQMYTKNERNSINETKYHVGKVSICPNKYSFSIIIIELYNNK